MSSLIKTGKAYSLLFKSYMSSSSSCMDDQILRRLVKRKNHLGVISLCKERRMSGAPADKYMLNLLVRSYCALRRSDLGFGMLGCFMKIGYIPNCFTCANLIKGLFDENRGSQGLYFFQMLSYIRKINEVTIIALIHGMSKEEYNIVTAVQLLRTLKKRNSRSAAYGSIVDSFCKLGMLLDAALMFNNLKYKGIRPNMETYFSLLCGYCKHGWVTEAKVLFVEMLELNMKRYINLRTFNMVIESLSKEGMIEDVSELMDVMVERGVTPNVVTYGALVNCYCWLGEMKEAEEVLNTMQVKGRKPDVSIYNILINGYCKNEGLDIAIQLFNQLCKNISSKGVKPNIMTYNTLLQALFHKGRCDAALDLFKEMQSRGVEANTMTLNIMMNGLCVNERVSEAIYMLESMQGTEVTPDIDIFSSFMDRLCKEKKVGDAKYIFDKISSLSLQGVGLKHTAKTYTIMINGLCQEGSFVEAKELLSRMKKEGLSPTEVTFNIMINAFLKWKYMLNETITLIKEMTKHGFSMDEECYTLLFERLSKDDERYFSLTEDVLDLTEDLLAPPPKLPDMPPEYMDPDLYDLDPEFREVILEFFNR